MPYLQRLKPLFLAVILLQCTIVKSQDILPPVPEWHGKSEALIARPDNKWITHTEKSGFETTPTYAETMDWLRQLTAATPLLSMISLGKSVEGRDIFMIIASTEKVKTPEVLKNSGKPALLVEAGIHSGEIDGKDAGMMLLRDIAFGGKQSLLDKVNFYFIPILNVDGHERSSPYNRPNQRGPKNMGWRTNAQNLNINRDFAKIDTREARAVVKVMNEYDPSMFMDIHVTDGADYQYDITFGGYGQDGYSPQISQWLKNTYKVKADEALKAQGHIPGQLMFAFNDKDFSEGNILSLGGARFSDSYGDTRHLASVLVENHSLKPFKQRVLGTYVLLEATLKLLATEGKELAERTKKDRSTFADEVPMEFKVPQLQKTVVFDAEPEAAAMVKGVQAPDSMVHLGVEHITKISEVTGKPYLQWTGKPITQTIVNYKATLPSNLIKRPKAYYVPAAWPDVIERLKAHGISMEVLTEAREVEVEQDRILSYKLENESKQVRAFEGHMQVNAVTELFTQKKMYAPGSVRIPTNQALGELAMILLEPSSKDSYFSWGFFNEILQRTEYMEAYVIEPMARKMLSENPALKAEFEQKKAEDPSFAGNAGAILSWFYSKSPYYDDRYLIYPVGREK